MEKKEIERVLERIYRFLKDNKGRFYVDDCETVSVYEGMSEIIEQELDKAREEGRIEQLKEDIEQVEMFLPKQVSDTDKYWIPTQILLELEDDLKLLKTKGEEKR